MSLSGPPLLRETPTLSGRLAYAVLWFSGFRNCFQRSIRILTFFWIPSRLAVSHLEFFPVEINQADYYELLRVPGIGYTSARRIIGARRTHSLEFCRFEEDLVWF